MWVSNGEGRCGISAASLTSAADMVMVLPPTNVSPEENGPTRIPWDLYPNGMNGLYKASEHRQCKGRTVVGAVTSCPDTHFVSKAFISPAGRSVSYWRLMANPFWRITLRWTKLLPQRLCPIRREAHTQWLAEVETQKSSPLTLIWDCSAGLSHPPSS